MKVVTAIRRLYSLAGADLPDQTSTVTPPDGRFPTITQSILWDLLPARLAPDADGMIPPRAIDADWVKHLEEGDLELRLSIAQAARTARQATVESTELKASRLLTPTVTLLAASAALAAYQLQQAGKSSAPLLASIWAIPAMLALLFFAISAVRSLDADVRVGFYKFAELRPDSNKDKNSFLRECVRFEILGEYWAKWTAVKKKNSLMQARAWFSRGIVTLVAALVIGAVTQIFASTKADSPPQPTKSVTPGPLVPPAPSFLPNSGSPATSTRSPIPSPSAT